MAKKRKAQKKILVDIPNTIHLVPGRTFNLSSITIDPPPLIDIIGEHNMVVDRVSREDPHISLREGPGAPEYELVLRRVRAKKTNARRRS